MTDLNNSYLDFVLHVLLTNMYEGYLEDHVDIFGNLRLHILNTKGGYNEDSCNENDILNEKCICYRKLGTFKCDINHISKWEGSM